MTGSAVIPTLTYRDAPAMIDWLEARSFVPSAFFANNKGHFPLLVEMDGIFVNRALVQD